MLFNGDSPGMGSVYSYFYKNDEDEFSCGDSEDVESDFSESTSEDEYVSKFANYTNMTNNLTTDTLNTTTGGWKLLQETPISLNHVREIENDLDQYEKVSIIFLVVDDAPLALEILDQTLKGENNFPITTAIEKGKIMQWQDKLLEALCIIQNFQLLQVLGMAKDAATAKYQPMNEDYTFSIGKSKKVLYRICENCPHQKTLQLIQLIKNDFERKQLEFRMFKEIHLEMYLLHWYCINYISGENFENFLQPLEEIGFTKAANRLKSIKVQNALPQEVRVESRNNLQELKYAINNSKPGYCLIINQEYFYNDPDADIAEELGRRLGTEIDGNCLQQTFARFGFDVDVKSNRDDYQIKEDILEAVNNVGEHSSFFLCILSHGIEGAIFGSNSLPVEISHIIDIISKNNTKHLAGKPKILIVQACQGSVCQTIEIEENKSILIDDPVKLDGPRFSIPHTADILIFWATVKGYEAIRDVRKGTWFIQALCETINQFGNEKHFDEICTIVKSKVIPQTWKNGQVVNVMVPMNETTLSKFFYFPPSLW